jgi:hypothetical protein
VKSARGRVGCGATATFVAIISAKAGGEDRDDDVGFGLGWSDDDSE